jgi:hypothetical protein
MQATLVAQLFFSKLLRLLWTTGFVVAQPMVFPEALVFPLALGRSLPGHL